MLSEGNAESGQEPVQIHLLQIAVETSAFSVEPVVLLLTFTLEECIFMLLLMLPGKFWEL